MKEAGKAFALIVNIIILVVFAFLTFGSFFMTSPIEASEMDSLLYKLGYLFPFGLYLFIAFLQVKFIYKLPIFKNFAFTKCMVIWIIIFPLGVSASAKIDTLYSQDYQERYAIYQQQQELEEEKDELEKQEKERQEQLAKDSEKQEKQENQQQLAKEDSKEEKDEQKQTIVAEDYSKYFEFRYVVEPIKGEGKNKDKRLVKYYTKNISDQIISAKEYVTFFDQTGKHIVGSQLGYIEELNPGYEAWSSIYVDDDFSSLKYEVEYSDVTFKKALQDNLQVDVETTQKVQEEFRLNFEEATWYKTIKSLEVYTDGSCKLIADTDNNGMASAVYFCCSQYGLKTVVVYNSAGTLVSSYSGK